MTGAAALVGLSALPWIWFSLGRFGGFDVPLFGFEVLTIVAAVYGVLLGRGWYREGWAIGVAAIAGSWLVCLVFGLFVGFYKAKMSDFPGLVGLTRGTIGLRAVMIPLAGLLATVAVFSRNPAAWRSAILGLAWALPLAIGGALYQFEIGPGAWVASVLEGDAGSSGGLRAVLIIGVGLVGIVLMSISGHLLIRAYESGRPDEYRASGAESV